MIPKTNQKKIAVLQSGYIPWKGTFDLINQVDEFIFYDDIEYSHGAFRNRNQICTPNGLQWLTIPIQIKGQSKKKIDEIRIANPLWAKKHWKTLQQNYGKTPYFATYRACFEALYLEGTERFLSPINIRFIKAITRLLGIKTNLRQSHEFQVTGDRSEKLIQFCKMTGAGCYVSGPAAKNYLDEELFNREGIAVEWMDFTGYPEYSQLHSPFEHKVSILDLIFNTGDRATKFMKSFNQK